MEVDTTIVSSVELNERTLTTVETAPGDLEPATACPVSKATNVATVRINMLYLTIARPRFHSGAGVAPKQGAVGVRDAHVRRSGWVGSASTRSRWARPLPIWAASAFPRHAPSHLRGLSIVRIAHRQRRGRDKLRGCCVRLDVSADGRRVPLRQWDADQRLVRTVVPEPTPRAHSPQPDRVVLESQRSRSALRATF